MKTTAIVAAACGITFFGTVAHYQESPVQLLQPLGPSIATSPTPNGAWSFAIGDQSVQGNPQFAPIIIELDIDTSQSTLRYATLTDLSLVWEPGNSGQSYWWITDENTGAVLWTQAATTDQSSLHLQTPLVFAAGPNKPTLTMGSLLANNLVAPFTAHPTFDSGDGWRMSAAGRYSYSN